MSSIRRLFRVSRLRALGALLLCAPLGATLAVQPQHLRFDTTEHLFEVCNASADSAAQLGCTGFIEATVQYHDAVSDRKNLKRLVCYPAGTTIEEGRQAFITWAQANQNDSDLMGELPVIGLVRALADAYPCR